VDPNLYIYVHRANFCQNWNIRRRNQNREVFLYDKRILISVSNWISSEHTENQTHVLAVTALARPVSPGVSLGATGRPKRGPYLILRKKKKRLDVNYNTHYGVMTELVKKKYVTYYANVPCAG
jgi:hypothetical protein